MVPRAGYELKTIDAYGLSKKISIENIKKMYKTFKGLGEAKRIIKEFKPDIVIGTGGYICGATISAAHSLGIPTLLHESNAFPGKAVKMLAKKTDTILVSFEDAKARIKNAKNIVCTGTPVKIVKKDYGINEKLEIIKKAGLNETKPIVLIFGGSQGAQRINQAVMDLIKLKKNERYQIIWATGPKQYDIVKEDFERNDIYINNIKNVKVLPYIYNMEEIMNISELLVCRSGAMTITEISIVGKPAIFIPLPSMSANRQEDNALVLKKLGAAEIILNEDMCADRLSEEIDDIIYDSLELEEMGKIANQIAPSNVEDKIYNEIKELMK